MRAQTRVLAGGAASARELLYASAKEDDMGLTDYMMAASDAEMDMFFGPVLGSMERGMTRGGDAVRDEKHGQEVVNENLDAAGEETGLKDMYEGGGDLPEIGEIVNAPGAVEKFRLGATKFGDWLNPFDD